MGAARHTQRHQEQAHRRIARSEPPTREEALSAMDREYAELVDDYAAAAQIIRALEAERDRLRAALDELREFAWQWAGDPGERADSVSEHLARRFIDVLARHGVGGDQ